MRGPEHPDLGEPELLEDLDEAAAREALGSRVDPEAIVK